MDQNYVHSKYLKAIIVFLVIYILLKLIYLGMLYLKIKGIRWDHWKPEGTKKGAWYIVEQINLENDNVYFWVLVLVEDITSSPNLFMRFFSCKISKKILSKQFKIISWSSFFDKIHQKSMNEII